MASSTATVAAPAHDAHGHDDHHGHDHPPHLKHYFVTSEQQFEAAKLGMWLFLVTEILLFGGMFVAYGIFRAWYPELFAEASTQLDTVMGATNTLVLLLSSFTVAFAIRGAQTDNQKVLFWNLVATVALAGVFMVIKYFEYTHKFDLGIFPGAAFNPTSDVVNPTEGIFAHPRAGVFFSIYYVMTGIHGFHVLIGMVAISILAWKARQGKYTSAWYTPVENVGLYWHVVDIIWIFLFPLMYLI
ncbi:MAG: cytochrome c oxidase subunit 3 family protein [Bacteroidota bacterium]